MKRSIAVSLIAAGSIAAGAYALTERRNCQPSVNGALPPGCSSSSSSRSGGGSSFFSSSGTSSSSSPGSTSGTSSTSRGGFGETGSAHSSGS